MSRNSISAQKQKKSDASSLYTLHRCLKTTYALIRDRNLDNFLYKIGVGKETRRRAANLKPTIKLTRKGDTYTLTTDYGDGKVNKITFELDKPMTRKLENGGDATCVFIAKDGKLEEMVTTNERMIIVTRLFTPSALTVKMIAENERCERFYKKVPKPDKKDIQSETSRRSVTTSGSTATGETFATESEIELRNIV